MSGTVLAGSQLVLHSYMYELNLPVMHKTVKCIAVLLYGIVAHVGTC